LWADKAARAFQIMDLVIQVVDLVDLFPDASGCCTCFAFTGFQSRPSWMVPSDGPGHRAGDQAGFT
jgi:hypothetical protein